MGNTNCCRPGTAEESKHELSTLKKDVKNNKVITDFEDIAEFSEIDKYKLPQTNLGIEQELNRPRQNELQTIIEAMNTAPFLSINIISSSVDPNDNALIITPLGMNDSIRRPQDGLTVFGYQEPNSPKLEGIDYVIHPKDDSFDDRFIGIHFYIRFEPNNQKYYLKDMGHGFGAFLKIIDPIIIKTNFLLNIGENYLVLTLGLEDEIMMSEKYLCNNDQENQSIINIKIFSGKMKHAVLSFTPNKRMIEIGRNPDCDVVIDDGMLSRVHTTILYINNEWIIQDGSIDEMEQVKRSTNGTWIYALEETELTDQTSFKANHNLFNCSLINKRP